MLGGILRETTERVNALRERERELTDLATRAAAPVSLAAALRSGPVSVIAEVKRRSPSKGTINEALTSATQVAAYARGGAAAISILTEPRHFGGSGKDLQEARASVSIPLLRKDFHIDILQLVEARGLGASAVLLIARALSPFQLLLLLTGARDLGLETLVEVRSEAELELAVAYGAAIIGVNSRDLETLVIDPRMHERLIPAIPADRIAVAESGIATAADAELVAAVGADAVLVGSAISAASDPAGAVRALTGVTRRSRGG